MLAGLNWTQAALLMLGGVLLDLLLGEPRRWHPLIGFGKLASALERLLNPASPTRRPASRSLFPPTASAAHASAPRTAETRPHNVPATASGADAVASGGSEGAASASAAPSAATPLATATPIGVEDVASRGNMGASGIARGALGWVLAVLPLVAISAACIALASTATTGAGWALHALLLYFTLGLRSLRDHNLPIVQALQTGDIAAARELTGRIVSRDTSNATPEDLAKASTESLLENGNDAVFGALFWFAIAGGPGVLLFRLANTLDAMWGYRTPRYNHFGRIAARIDDILNFLPARLTAFSYALLAPTLAGKQRALRCWREQAPAWSSPNAGPVMSAGAGALGLALGGPAVYDGEIEQRPPLGAGAPAARQDIVRAWRLIHATCWLWLAAALAIAGAQYA